MRRIFTSLAPNVERDDRRLAQSLLIRPWRWRGKEAVNQLEKRFVYLTGFSSAAAFTSGRGALYAILKSLNLPKGSEVLLQAFTCVAVPGPVLWAGLTPIYIDCNDELTISAEDLEKKITKASRVLIIQHTFGQPADLDKLLAIAQKHNLFVIEDCAHALGGEYRGKKLGTFGDAAFFSFGRDKALSAVFGGVAVIREEALGKKLLAYQQQTSPPGFFWIAQQLLHPPILSLAKRFYDTASLGKIVLELAKRLRLISRAVYPIEKKGGAPRFVFRRMPNATALLALHQLEKLERFTIHRRQLALLYSDALRATDVRSVGYGSGEGAFLRYAVFHPKAGELINFFKMKGVELGDWYSSPLAPAGVDYARLRYTPGSCPVAEKYAGQVFNLPTHIGIQRGDAEYLIRLIKEFLF